MRRIAEIDGLRAILAFWVVFVHVSRTVYDVHDIPFSGILYNEQMRVKIFFMISGMVVFAMLDKDAPAYKPYILSRIRRIYPAYIVAAIASISMIPITQYALDTIPFFVPQNLGRMKVLQSTIDFLPYHSLSHAFMVHGIVPVTILPYAPTAIIGQAWNISTEFQFYLIAPLLMLLLKHRASIVVPVIACLAVSAFAARWYPNTAIFFRSAVYFYIGMSTYYFIRYFDTILPAVSRGLLFIAVMAIGILVSAFIDMAMVFWVMFIALTMPYYVEISTFRPVRFLSSKIFSYLGSLSYSVYLLHMIAMHLTMYVINSISLSRFSYFLILLVSTVMVSVILSILVHKFIEAPFMRAGRSHRLPSEPDRSRG